MAIYTQDQEIRKILAEIGKTLTEVNKTGLGVDKIRALTTALEAQATKLNDQLTKANTTTFSYEFYRESSDVVEQISRFRLDPALKNQLNNFLDIFNRIVAIIREAVFRHKALTQPASHEAQLSKAKNPLDAAQLRSQIATANAVQAAADAEKANEAGLEYIEKFNELNQKGEKINQHLVDESFEHTVTIFAKNAAAVLAADEAACALVNLNEAIEQEKKRLS